MSSLSKEIIGQPTIEECMKEYPFLSPITYTSERTGTIVRYVRGYVFEKTLWFPAYAAWDGGLCRDYMPMGWEDELLAEWRGHDQDLEEVYEKEW